MQRIRRWLSRLDQHEFIVALETDPVFWGMAVFPFTLSLQFVG